MKPQPIYFSGLNGLRAISALAVVVSHTTLALKEFNLNPTIFGTFPDGSPRGLALASHGVTFFFVISGFLITYLLLEEKNKTSTVSIKKFYFRRLLRIWPLYYLYLAIALAVIYLTHTPISLKVAAMYIFFSANIPFILKIQLPYIVHYWSLGVEEQFYLIWPWLNKYKLNIKWFSLIAIVFFLLAKLYVNFISHQVILSTALHVTRMNCMLIGALGAVLYKENNQLFSKILNNKISQGVAWIVVILIALNKFHVANVIDDDLIACCALIIIIGQIKINNRIINLENAVFDFLGKISYGMYVIHPLIIFALPKIIKPFQSAYAINYCIIYSIIISSTIVFSYLSYTYYEKYFMKMKEKFVIVRSQSSAKKFD